ncbi:MULTISPECIES: hypothetical protein [Streptomyces]|jgi:hypothetical protein|uniref:Uncharacterized protein n=1 Tax=Streptomyces sp. 900129855 TaxID=3155129 RepID=A0ABV2ZH19_9ACTN
MPRPPGCLTPDGLDPALADEGLIAALRRMLHMRRGFRRHSAHLGAISLVAVPTPVQA